MAVRFLFAVLFGGTLLSATSDARANAIEDCKKKSNNQAVYECLKGELEDSQLDLKHAAENLSLILKRIDGTYAPKINAVRSFKSAHDEWEEYRNKECGFLGSVMMWGGSGSPQAILECLIKTTDKRAEQYGVLIGELKKTYLE